MTTATQAPAALSVAQADRMVALSAGDDLRFAPAAIGVRTGETIAFRVTNTGQVTHEFVVGDAAAQDQHEKEMSAGGMGAMQDANAISVAPGETATLVFTFTQPGVLYYGCHETGALRGRNERHRDGHQLTGQSDYPATELCGKTSTIS